METQYNQNAGAIEKISYARNALMEAKGLDDILKIRDVALAAATYAKAAKLGLLVQNEAAEIKIRAERKAGEFFKQIERKSGARTDVTSSNTGLGLTPYKKALEESSTTRQEVNRWEKIADIPEDKFEKHIAEKKQNVENAVNELTTAGILHFANTGAHVSNNSGDNEWYTPKEYLDAVKSVMGCIDVDPASSQIANTIVQAATYYTVADDGRNKDWTGNVFMNPPYAHPLIDEFTNKLISEIQSGNTKQAIVLVNNATETKWFQSLANKAAAVCFPQSRLKFWSPEKASATPLQGQAFLYFGNDIKAFRSEFEKYGFVAVIR